MHIIKPSLVKVSNIIEAINKNQFHYSWLLIILNRAFIHESKFIVRWAVNCFLQSDVHLLLAKIPKNIEENQAIFIDMINSFILKNLLVTIQKSHIFKKLVKVNESKIKY